MHSTTSRSDACMSSDVASRRPVLLLGYDTERHRSATDIAEELHGLETIATVHRDFNVPATFFVLGRLIEECPAGALQQLIGHPQFELQSHTYSHPLLRHHATRGEAISADALRMEL